MVDIAMVLDSLVPGAEYEGTLGGEMRAEFEALRWFDTRAKPTWAAVVAEWPAVQTTINEERRLERIERHIANRWTVGQIAQAIADNDDGNASEMTRLKADIAAARAVNP